MDTNTYYFSNFTEDDDLSNLAVKAKEVMRQNDNIVQIFKINNEVLCGDSPKHVLFLMKLNKQSLFSPTSSNENSPIKAKSYERKSTPTKPNPGTSYMPRRCLPLDDAEKKDHPATLEFSAPTGRRKPIVQPAAEAISNPSVDKTSLSDASQVGFTGNPEAGSQVSSPTTELARMTTNLTMAEKDFESPVKVHGRIDASSQESSPTMAEKELRSPVKEIGKIKEGNQESLPSAKINRMISSLTVDVKESRNLNQDDQQAGIPATNKNYPNPEENASKSESSISSNKHFISHSELMETTEPVLITSETLSPVKRTRIGSIPPFDTQECSSTSKKGRMEEDSPENTQVTVSPIAGAKLNCTRNKDSPNPEEIAGKSESTDSSNKYFISHAEGMKTSEPAPCLLRNRLLGICETTSPVKKAKIGSIPTFDIQEPSGPKKDAMAENSPEDTKRTVSRTPGAKLNITPIETIKGIARDDRKRKSLSPTRRSTTPFKTVPKVIKLESEEEMGVEVVDLEYGASPTTSRSKSADYRRDSTKDSSFKSPAVCESKMDTSPKTPERYLRPSERASASRSSRNVSGTNSPGCSADIEANPALLKATIQKFNSLLVVRDGSMKNSFISFQCFQTGISYTNNYVLCALQILLMIDLSGKCSTEEFKKIVRDANAISEKLLNKLKSWEKDLDLNIYACHKCFQKIEQLKAKYEPLFTNEGEPAVTFEAMQVYECEMRALWKEMDGLVMLGDSRRVLFAHIARDVERLIKMLVKSLILVGILQPR